MPYGGYGAEEDEYGAGRKGVSAVADLNLGGFGTSSGDTKSPTTGSMLSGAGGALGSFATGLSMFQKSKGDLAEARSYDLAAQLAGLNATFTETATGIKVAQEARTIYKTIGGQKADVAGSGLKESGSALDLLASSSQQGALATATIQEQGLITEAGYKEQQQSYEIMADAARSASSMDQTLGWINIAAGALKLGGAFI